MKPILLVLLGRMGLLRQLSPSRVRQWIKNATVQHVTDDSEVFPSSRQLLVDISVVHWHDAGTGIQRVVRSVLSHLTTNPPPGFIVRCVVAQRKQPYLYADTLGEPGAKQIDVRSGDIFLGLDLVAHLLPQHFNQLLNWKLAGASLHFMVYDMLPLTHPAHFTRPRVRHFKRWARLLAIMADGLLCISHCVRTDVQTWFQINSGLSANQLHTTVIPLGGDFPPKSLSEQPSEKVIETLATLKDRRWALMVGTLEPRKCHAEVLDAFEHLWQQGEKCALVFVGHPGWQTDTLQYRITRHPQINRNLFWFNVANDADLERFYQETTGVVVASLAEGYGLPLSEAIHHNKPLLVRDIPIFREVGSTNAAYFSNDSSIVFSQTLKQWLSTKKCNEIVKPFLTTNHLWSDTTMSIVNSITKNNNLASELIARR